MDIVLLVKAAIMGVVEGLTEFLPISSTGHLILAGALLGFDDAKAKVFDIAIQTGAIFAVILVYWQRIRDTVVALPTSAQARRFALNVLIGFFPAVLLGLLLGKAIKAHLFTPTIVAGYRQHSSLFLILVLNVLLGWTLLGWLLLLIWACFGDSHTTWARTVEKKCPYCAEYIKAEAIKCKHCGSDLAKTAIN